MKNKTKHPLYITWMGMKARCSNPNQPGWPWYGGKGIRVCERWLDFDNFVEDMGERPAGTSIDRIDSSRNYEPGNCRWATLREQNRNKSDMVILNIEGKDYLAVELGELAGMKTDTIIERARQGLSYEDVISPIRRKAPEEAFRGMVARNKAASEARFCHMGHEFTKENTILNKVVSGHFTRRCRECHRLTVLRYKERKRKGL